MLQINYFDIIIKSFACANTKEQDAIDNYLLFPFQ